MRIVTGQLGGRIVQAPRSASTRPMTDKVRAALFDSLGSVEHKRFLDAYAGSGAVGFEAWSRGASDVQAIEHGHQAIKATRANLEILGIDWGYRLHAQTVESWLAHHNATNQPEFDVIVADPPYDRLKADILEKLGCLLTKKGILIVSHSSKQPLPLLEGLSQVSNRIYGDSALAVYRPSAR